MYDRKTWVAIALCGALLALNFYYSSKTSLEQKALRESEEVAKKNAAPPAEVAVKPVVEAATELPPAPATEETVLLETPEVVFTLTNIGGGIKQAAFKNQFQVGKKSALVELNHFGAGPVGGLVGAGEKLENLAYTYKAEDSAPGKKAVFIAKLPSGLIAKKTFSLVESDKAGTPYLLNFELQLENAAATEINLNQWSIFLGEASPLYQDEVGPQTGFFWHENGSMLFKDTGAFKGSMWGGAAPEIVRSEAGLKIEYAGVTNQYFTTVVRPSEPQVAGVWGKTNTVKVTEISKTPTDTARAVDSVNAGLQLPSTALGAGQSKTISYLIFMGPKHNDMLRKMEASWGAGWGDLMQYGSWMQWSARPLNYVLNLYHRLFDGMAKQWAWGLAVIFLTLTVRLLIWPLHAKSTHTMKRMSKLQPEMAKIKEKYADDPSKINTETMGLYRKYGINPLGGCLPMLIQIPIFFGFYRMLQYAVELRGHGFLWVNDLSQPDTLTTLSLPFSLPFIGSNLAINILPIIMALSSFQQLRMTPKTGDPTQQKIMMFMPFMFFFFCYNFASALALYWTTQNIFSIGQTYLMNKVPEPELKARKVSDKKSFLQRMADRQLEMQKAKANGGMRNVTPTDEKKKPRPPRTGG
jgi:YidC/Oxa1 family membrane protein insertase